MDMCDMSNQHQHHHYPLSGNGIQGERTSKSHSKRPRPTHPYSHKHSSGSDLTAAPRATVTSAAMSEPLRQRGIPSSHREVNSMTATKRTSDQITSQAPSQAQFPVNCHNHHSRPTNHNSHSVSPSSLVQSHSCNLSNITHVDGEIPRHDSCEDLPCQTNDNHREARSNRGSDWRLVDEALKFIDSSSSSSGSLGGDDEQDDAMNTSVTSKSTHSVFPPGHFVDAHLRNHELVVATSHKKLLSSPLNLPFNPPMPWSKASSMFERWRLDSPIMSGAIDLCTECDASGNRHRRRQLLQANEDSDRRLHAMSCSNRSCRRQHSINTDSHEAIDYGSDEDDLMDELLHLPPPPPLPTTSPPHSPPVCPPGASTPIVGLRRESHGGEGMSPLVPGLSSQDASPHPQVSTSSSGSTTTTAAAAAAATVSSNGWSALLPPWLENLMVELENHFPPEERYHQPPKAVERDAAHRLAKRLFHLDGFKMVDVTKHLAKRNDFNHLVGEEFLKLFDFTEKSIDEALREFLRRFALIGDTQERERILHHLAHRYMHFHPHEFSSEALCHTLLCAILILNTDLHGYASNRRPSCDEFIQNLLSATAQTAAMMAAVQARNSLPRYPPIRPESLSSCDTPSATPSVESEELATSSSTFGNGGLCWEVPYDLDELRRIYEVIRTQPIYLPHNEGLAGMVDVVRPVAHDVTQHILFGNMNPFLEVPSEKRVKEFMRGYLMRKLVMENYTKKAGLGKRSWKLFFVCLRDLVLYFYRDAESVPPLNRSFYGAPNPTAPTPNMMNGADTNGNTEDATGAAVISNPGAMDCDPVETNVPVTPFPVPPAQPEGVVRIEHSFSQRATGYRKRPNVFHLRTKDGAEYLFHVSDPKEMDLWIDSLNFVAALLSAPPEMPTRLRNDGKLCRPFLPSTYTTFNIREQLEQHQLRILLLTTELSEHEKSVPGKFSRAKERHEYEEKLIYLKEELVRYKTYARLLEGELAALQAVLLGHLNFFHPLPPPVMPPQGAPPPQSVNGAPQPYPPPPMYPTGAAPRPTGMEGKPPPVMRVSSGGPVIGAARRTSRTGLVKTMRTIQDNQTLDFHQGLANGSAPVSGVNGNGNGVVSSSSSGGADGAGSTVYEVL